jgi:hypothetical protein
LHRNELANSKDKEKSEIRRLPAKLDRPQTAFPWTKQKRWPSFWRIGAQSQEFGSLAGCWKPHAKNKPVTRS